MNVRNIVKHTLMRYIFLLFLALPLCAYAQFSNGFAPVGAVWQDTWSHQWERGEIFTTVTNSNVIGNATYKTLHVNKLNFYNNTATNHDTYLIVRNDSVWITDAQQQPQRLLYDFGAQVGDTLELDTYNHYMYAKADSVKTISFLGQQKRAIYYNLYCRNSTRIGYKTFVLVQDFGLVGELWNWDSMWQMNPCIIACFGPYYTSLCYNDPTRSYPQNCVVSTEERTKNTPKITIFPNPTTDFLQINSTEPIVLIKITDLLGKTVLEKTENNFSTNISIETLPKGVYFLRINNAFVQKIVKN